MPFFFLEKLYNSVSYVALIWAKVCMLQLPGVASCWQIPVNFIQNVVYDALKSFQVTGIVLWH
jgi:hypothetical protein